eukprot:TRINITY_DN1925_c0_g1_i1.p2 TRINITY_DN1925_c0_g1~~TRINITY_DN1925_c0_g1_i1.p2  ORF type:complete len:168 (+),score=25.36 TRINITY_DN1925_c0_g1_i1:72-575(+)
MSSAMLLSAVTGYVAVTTSAGIDPCPGEGPRYGDFKCNHDETHRVCAQLLDSETKNALSWGDGDFWQITKQEEFRWEDQIKESPNPGDSWCICMWATANLIEKVGCENVHLRCESTDVATVMKQYNDAGTDLAPAHACLKKKCGDTSLVQIEKHHQKALRGPLNATA